jgi:hypothetical protein
MVLFTLIPLIASTIVLKEGVKAVNRGFQLVANDNGKKINLGIARTKAEAGIMKQNFMNQRQINNLSKNINKNFGGV